MTGRSQDGQDQQRRRSRVWRAWADLPMPAKGLVVIAIPLLAMLLATVLFGVALAQDRRAQGAVLHTVEVEREIAQVRILVRAGVTGYVLTGGTALPHLLPGGPPRAAGGRRRPR